jgi:hypothetical protein
MTAMTIRSALFAAVAGLLTRPCCVIPAALSLAGVSSAGLSSIFMTHRAAFLATSVVCGGVSLWLTFMRGGNAVGKWVTVLASVIAFLISAGTIGVLDVF